MDAPPLPHPQKIKKLSAPILMPAETKESVLISASVERFGVSHVRDFSNLKKKIIQKKKSAAQALVGVGIDLSNSKYGLF